MVRSNMVKSLTVLNRKENSIEEYYYTEKHVPLVTQEALLLFVYLPLFPLSLPTKALISIDVNLSIQYDYDHGNLIKVYQTPLAITTYLLNRSVDFNIH